MQTRELNDPDFTSSPSTPSVQPNTNHVGGEELSATLTNFANSPTAEQNKGWSGAHVSGRKTIRRGSSRPISLKSSTPIMKSRASGHSGYANVYDVPSSGDEQSSLSGNRQKRRKIGAVRDESPSIPTTLPHRQQRSVLRKPISRRSSPQDRIIASNTDVNVPAGTRVEVVIDPSQRASSESQHQHNSATAKKDSKGISHQANMQPTSRPNYTPAEQYIAEGKSNHPEQPVLEQVQTRNRTMEHRRAKPVDDILVATTPGRKRLVDGLNMSGSDVDEPLISTIVDPRGSPPPSPSFSESSLVHPNPKNSGPSRNSTSHSDNSNRRAPPQNSQAIGARITYARQRSFLSETNIPEDPEQLKISDPLDVRQSYGARDSSTTTKVMPVGTDDEGGITTTGAVRNIHELRQAGGNARFQGMVDSIFEDFEDDLNPISRKRSGLIQLCCKLVDYQFARQFLENGIEKRLASTLKDQVDTISSSLAIYACALLLSTGLTSNTTLSACCSVILELTPQLLQKEEDITVLAKHRRMNSSRAEQASLRDLCVQSLKSRIWPDKTPTRVSPQILAMRCLEMAVRKVREKGESLEMISGTALDQLVAILLRHSRELQASSALPNNFLALELVFSILESYTVEMSSLGAEQELTIKQMSSLGPFLSFLTEQGNAPSRQLQILNIRLILNVTNNNPPLCEDFATSELIGALVEIILSKFGLVSEDFVGEKREPVLDIVILALGTLINLTEWSEASRKLVLRCQKNSAMFIDGLLQLFMSGLDAIFEV